MLFVKYIKGYIREHIGTATGAAPRIAIQTIDYIEK